MADVLYIFAHPDDESFAVGGTICHYHSQGKTQTLYCATRGEAGKTGQPPVCSREELGNVRRQELQRAIAELGIDRLILRDYGDGKLPEVPFSELVTDLVQVLEEEKPEIVITFDPCGISGHRDHITIQQATLEAVKQVDFSTTLYYVIIPDSVAAKSKLPYHSTPDHKIDHSINVTAYRENMVAALRAHRSQHLSLERAFPEIINGELNKFRDQEYFQLGYKK